MVQISVSVFRLIFCYILFYGRTLMIHVSLTAYEKSLSLAEDERDKSDILVAMGMVAYTAGNPDLAKSHLLKR